VPILFSLSRIVWEHGLVIPWGKSFLFHLLINNIFYLLNCWDTTHEVCFLKRILIVWTITSSFIAFMDPYCSLIIILIAIATVACIVLSWKHFLVGAFRIVQRCSCMRSITDTVQVTWIVQSRWRKVLHNMFLHVCARNACLLARC